MSNNNSEPVSINQPAQPTASALASTDVNRCINCIYFSIINNDHTCCAVNPVAAERYSSWQPNDCVDFQSNLPSEELMGAAGTVPPAPELMTQLQVSLAQAEATLHQQRRELGTYQRQSAVDAEQIALLTSRGNELKDCVNELYQRQQRRDELHNSWPATRVGVVVFTAVLIYAVFIILAGPKNLAGYSFGFFAGGLTVFFVRA